MMRCGPYFDSMAKKLGLKIGLGVLGVLIVAFAVFSAYIWFSGGSGEPTAAAVAERSEPRDEAARLFEVIPGSAEAQFIIGEVLRGRQNDVVGSTDQIDGSFSLGFSNGAVEIGQFVINLRSIQTDDEMRDRTIRTMILQTNRDEFEFSTFTPTSVEGAPSSISVGDTLQLRVTGDLAIRDVTRPVDFDMELTVQSEQEITGTAAAVITWDEFDITIPYVGGNSIVASVEDEVRLRMEFLARAN
ncbi:MAG: YceI family protein [Spirochaetaceae bacterium]|nr:MAG: YceI family protein [Spirochaetaceae bacterium]